MADNTRYPPPRSLGYSPFYLQQILEEAKHRWLRPDEILQILGNHRMFKLTPDPPVRPSAGSLFLFDRKTLRYFRKDGHRWRKKKDGKAVREAHEKLKSGSVDVLHCYYAHGEDNQNFQRRCYWMLDGKLEHIVLVHYRDVKEGGRSGMPQLLPDPSSQPDSPQPSSASPLLQAATPAFVAQRLFASSPDRISQNCQSLPSQFGDVDSRHNLEADSLSGAVHGSVSQGASLLGKEVEEFSVSSRNPCELRCVGCKFFQSAGSSLCPETASSSASANLVHGLKLCACRVNGGDFVAHKLTDSSLDDGGLDSVMVRGRLISDVDDQTVTAVPKILIQEHDINLTRPRFLSCSDGQNADSFCQRNHGGENDKNSGELKKLDSFGRWVDKEIGGDCDGSLMASDSGNYWNTLGTENDDKEASNLSHHMQLDVESLGPSISQDQLFSIHDFSPDWAYSGVETKVLIVGAFLGSKKFSTEHKWGCMFGEIEVSAEVLTHNVIRCQAPLHASGRVPFYITCRNRLACSEVREFEYRETPSDSISLYVRSMQREELRLQVRLAKLLCLGPERKRLNCCTEECDKCKLSSTLNLMRNSSKKDSATIRENCRASEVNPNNSGDEIIQSFLKDRLYQWLVCKVHEGGKGPDVLDDEGQGAIHLAASLGYEWAMGLIISASNNPNFRDAQGRTALHCASYFGREETVIALVRLGVDPSAVNDPTRTFPGGRTAADIASSQGHKGIAGYLAEAFLTKHLSSLNIKENATDSVDATILADQATKIAASLVTLPLNGEVDEHLSLRGSLAAIRKSALAASLIQAAYRSYSFRYRKLPDRNDDSGVELDLAALGFLNKDQRSYCFEDYLHSAAIKIQQKYRGWKGRKEFIKIRNRIVKVQAHVRGCQVRNQYKKVIWSVSIVEKAILRWRRKGCGLRGFRVEKTIGDSMMGTDKTDEYEFLRISRNQKFAGVEKALARVQSMVRDPVARDQYTRLVAESEKFKHGSENI